MKDIDPKFKKIADKAAANYLRNHSSWFTCFKDMDDADALTYIARVNGSRSLKLLSKPTFRRPTSCKSGFYQTLLNISRRPGQTSRQLAEEAGVKSLAYTLKHLNDSELVKKHRNSGINRWKIAPLGRKYLKAAAECSQMHQDCARDFRTA